jgi:RNA polymerase sigma-32 factor
LPGGEGVTGLDGLVDDRMNQEELLSECQLQRKLRMDVATAVSALNEKERFVIEHRVSADTPLTLQEIASRFSISRERVRQIEEAAIKKLKQSLVSAVAVG